MERLLQTSYRNMINLRHERIMNELHDLREKGYNIDDISERNVIYAFKNEDIYKFILPENYPSGQPRLFIEEQEIPIEYNEFMSLHEIIMQTFTRTVPREESDFIIYITAAGFFIQDNIFTENYLALLTNIMEKIYSNGYVNIHLHCFDNDLERYTTLYTSMFDNVIIHNEFLRHADLVQFENIDNFLLIDCAHITRYRLGSDRLHNDFKVIVSVVQEGETTGPDIIINSIYPSFLNGLNREFVSTFEFIRFEGKKIKTFIWSIINKRMEFKIKNGRVESIDTVIKYNENGLGVLYIFGILLSIYSVEFINQLIWS